MPNFESFHRGLIPQRSQPLVTIQKRGAISLNRAAHRALEEPKAVELLYDREQKIIGLRPTDTHAENAYAVRPATTARGPFVVSAMAFTRFYEIDTAVSRRWPAYIEDGVLCVDLQHSTGEPITSNRAGNINTRATTTRSDHRPASRPTRPAR